MKLYTDNGQEWVAARNKEEIPIAIDYTHGKGMWADWYSENYTLDDYEELPMDQPLTMRDEDGSKITKTVEEWLSEIEHPCVAFSTEW